MPVLQRWKIRRNRGSFHDKTHIHERSEIESGGKACRQLINASGNRGRLRRDYRWISRRHVLWPNSTMPTFPWRPRQTRDAPFSQNRLPRSFGEVGVMEFGLKGTSQPHRFVADVTRGSRHSGIWALLSYRCTVTVARGQAIYQFMWQSADRSNYDQLIEHCSGTTAVRPTLHVAKTDQSPTKCLVLAQAESAVS